MTEQARWARVCLDVLARAAVTIASAALVGMAIVEGWQVFARYVLNDSPSWTEPVALLLMSTVMMLGAAVGTRNDAHFGFFIAVEAAPAQDPPRAARAGAADRHRHRPATRDLGRRAPDRQLEHPNGRRAPAAGPGIPAVLPRRRPDRVVRARAADHVARFADGKLGHGHRHPVRRAPGPAGDGRTGGVRADRSGARHGAVPRHAGDRRRAADRGGSGDHLAPRHPALHLRGRDDDARRHLRPSDRARRFAGRSPARRSRPGERARLALLRGRVGLRDRGCFGDRRHHDSADGCA